MRNMEQTKEMEWTDGAGDSLIKLGREIKKVEKTRHDINEEYFGDGQYIVMDMETGSAVILQTKPHEGGKTQGHGFRRCKMVTQRIPHKVPTSLKVGVLLDMLVAMLAKGDETGPLAEAAYQRIVNAMLEAQEKSISTDKELAVHWKKRYAKHKEKVDEMIEKINEMTWTERAGDALTCIEAIPLTNAVWNEVVEQIEVSA